MQWSKLITSDINARTVKHIKVFNQVMVKQIPSVFPHINIHFGKQNSLTKACFLLI